MRIAFHGADRGVTGSCHLVEFGGKRILVDCGLFQGGRELEEENAGDFGFDAASIDLVLLTHAHLDHCGRLPLLTKRKFHGEIIATPATRDLARLVLLDAAHLQKEEAERRGRRTARRGRGDQSPSPLYGEMDAFDALARFGRDATYGVPIELAPGLRATFVDAGHILGSASIVLEAQESERRLCVVFSGDVGNAGRPLLRAPVTPPPPVDAVIMETTYGDRAHKPIAPSVEELYAAVTQTFERGGNVLIPTFALERAQEILYFLRQGVEQRRLPHSMQVFLDSPMAISATEIYRRHLDAFSPETAHLLTAGTDPFAVPGLHVTRDVAESEAIDAITSGAIIMAGSGMATGGRIRRHFQRNLWRSECAVVFVGYAAAGTLARQIIDGAKHVRLFGDDVRVQASIHTINGFSAHADQAELLAWRERMQPARTILVHGDEQVMRTFAGRLPGARVDMPGPGDAVEL
ncbi:MBL fold metallo-hydrolase [bacterium]|nr:MAG: MBL fold metallo-hydrolase [bacterium]